VYWCTLAPTVGVGDSGELTAAAHVLGIPHPTGYPLWLLLAKAFSSVFPFGTVAWRLNLLSALCAAGAAQFLASALRRLGCGRLAAFGGGLTLALLGPIWSEATVARTYPLAALFSAAMLWTTARWIVAPRDRTLVEHGALLGFGLANHLMVIAHVPALLAVVAGRAPERLRRPKLWLVSLLALVPGLLLYLYLPWRAAAHPPLEYRVPMEPGGARPWPGGEAPRELVELSDLSHSGAALRAYLARDFHQSHAWATSAADHATILGHHLMELVRELGILGVAFALLGAIALWRGGRRSLVVAVALLWLFNLLPLALHGAWWDLFLYPRYLTTGFVGVALLVGVGMDAVARHPRPRLVLDAAKPPRPAIWAAVIAALALPALLLDRNWARCDRRDSWLAEDYGRALLAELPPGAQLLSGSDGALYPLFTLRFVEGARPDVQLVSPLQLPGDPDRSRPLFTPDLGLGFDGRERERRGLLCRLRPPREPAQPREPYAPPTIRGLERDDEPDPFARSLIGAIEADLADAAAVRGDRAQARSRLERVVRLRCPRPWGNVTGLWTLFRLSEEERKRGDPQGVAQAREDLELALLLVTTALECGDPRDRDVLLWKEDVERALK
jgi:hypothetical protein